MTTARMLLVGLMLGAACNRVSTLNTDAGSVQTTGESLFNPEGLR